MWSEHIALKRVEPKRKMYKGDPKQMGQGEDSESGLERTSLNIQVHHNLCLAQKVQSITSHL